MDEKDPDEMYSEGLELLNKGEEADIIAAAELFRKAGEHDHVGAKRTLGMLYLEGVAIERDLEKAYSLIAEASVAMDPFAMYTLGRMYEGGIGVEQNDREALYMFASVAEMGIPGAEADAERIMRRIKERMVRKLRARPILNLEISDVEVEAVCCKKMMDAVMEGTIEVMDTYKGPDLVIDDEDRLTFLTECPFCGSKPKRVSKDKIY